MNELQLPAKDILNNRMAIVCHDAGATNLIIGWIKRLSELNGVGIFNNLEIVAEGPARKIWNEYFPLIKTVCLNEALADVQMLLSGTGWESSLEHQSRSLARTLGLTIFAVVDHWINYRQRFVRDGKEILPDEVWVGDPVGYDIACAEFPNLTIRQFSNIYLLDQIMAISASDRFRDNSNHQRVLYALEPIHQIWNSSDTRPGEFQALDYFLSNLSLLGLNDTTEIRLRPHPSDPPGKYDSFIRDRARYNLHLELDEPISSAVSWSDIVVGCETFVLIIGIFAKRRVVSTLPPWGHGFRLPHKEIERMS